VRNIFYKDDGGFVLVAEQYKLVTRTDSKGNVHYIYYYCDVACLNFNADGSLKAMTKIPKYQKNAANPSIKATYLNGKTYVIYEDLTKNMHATSDKKTKRSSRKIFSNGSNNSLFLLTVEDSGEVKKDILFNYKDSKIRQSVLGSVRSGKNKIILHANDQIGLLTF